MARPLPFVLMQQKLVGFLPASFIFLSVFSAVIFLCGAHHGVVDSIMGKEKPKTVRLGGDRSKKKEMMEKMRNMVSWRKVEDYVEGKEEEEEVVGDDEDGVVWKKRIMKGEKCRALDFSGQILYDSNGKLLPD